MKLTSTQRAKKSAEDRVEEHQAIHDILQQSTFNFPNLHCLSDYGSHISDFGTLPHYSTEITEALHKPLTNTYRHSNRVDAVEQVLDTISMDDALQMKELNLIAWSLDIRLRIDIQTLLGIEKGQVAPKSTRSPSVGRPVLRGRQAADSPPWASFASLASTLEIPSLAKKLGNYLRLNHPDLNLPPASEQVSRYRAHYYSTLSVPGMQFQGDGELIHQVWWTRKRSFRQRVERRADWVWVHQRGLW